MSRLTLTQAALLAVVLFTTIWAAHVLDRRKVSPLDIIARLFRRFRKKPSEIIEGYEHPELIDVIFRKTIAYRPEGIWPEMAGVNSVLDFGGGCGLHYKQANSKDVRWAVVETPAMVTRASKLATDKLRFFTSIAEAATWLGDIDVMHSSGALQYVPEPSDTLKALCCLGARTMLWRRMFLSTGIERQEIQVSHLVDNGPGAAPSGIRNKLVRIDRNVMTETEFIAAHSFYSLVGRDAQSFRFRLLA